MCQALLEIMEPEIIKIKEEARREAIEQTRRETIEQIILCAVKDFRDLGAGDDRIMEILKNNYGFSDAEAKKYL